MNALDATWHNRPIEPEQALHFYPTDKTIVQMLAEGKTKREISIALGMNHGTINARVRAARQRNRANSDVELVLRAISQRLVTCPWIDHEPANHHQS